MTNKHVDMYKQMHERTKIFSGRKTAIHSYKINSLIGKTGSKTLLDYGCGKGRQYSERELDKHWGVDVACYDPGVPEFSVLPDGKFDGVICVDVLEHVPEYAIEEVLENIFNKADKFIFMNVALFPSKKGLPNGENCHVTLKPTEWWLEKIEKKVGHQEKVVINFEMEY